MSISTITPWSGDLPPPLPLRKFRVDEYHRMIEAGVFEEDDPFELLEGWIVRKMPRTPSHDAIIDQAREIIESRLPAAWRVRVQSAITTEDSEPEPDLAVVRGPASRYLDHHPSPAEIAIVVEVADSSLAHDRGVKGSLYARAGMPHYWIINLVEARIEAYFDVADPSAPAAYLSRRDYLAGDSLPLWVEGRDAGAIPVNAILGA